jgi:hypothetical protein
VGLSCASFFFCKSTGTDAGSRGEVLCEIAREVRFKINDQNLICARMHPISMCGDVPFSQARCISIGYHPFTSLSNLTYPRVTKRRMAPSPRPAVGHRRAPTSSRFPNLDLSSSPSCSSCTDFGFCWLYWRTMLLHSYWNFLIN